MKKRFEVMVVGGGTAGLRTAVYASNHGHKTVMIEPSVIGGTCLNKGCIPTKAMLHASHLFESTHGLDKYGINVSGVKLDFPKLMKRVHSIINSGQSHISQSLKKSDLTVIRKKAVFVDKKSVRAGKDTISADKIIICTGAKTFIPPIKGLDKVKYWISDDVINIKKLPKSIIIIGGGYISTEFATFFSELGSKVTILERSDRILQLLDEDVASYLTDLYRKKGIEIIPHCNIFEVSEERGVLEVFINDLHHPRSRKRIISAEALLLATGRVPNTKDLGLGSAGIKVSKRGSIIVNDNLRTSNPHVYAIGDCNGRAMFAHAAKRESHVALENALDGKKSKINFKLMPWAMFSNPPIAGIGLSEAQALEKGHKIKILKAGFVRAGRATVMGDTRGFVKVLVEKKSKKVLGCVIIGPRADDLIHEFVAIMNSRSPKLDTVRKAIHIHPTLSEVMEALK